MIATFNPCSLHGKIDAPSSKSMAHRYLICASLAKGVTTLYGISFNKDILATIDCLRELGAKIEIDKDKATVDSTGFMKAENPVLECGESGSTLRFFIPLALCLGKKTLFKGNSRLFERPLSVYEELCREKGFTFDKGNDSLSVLGNLQGGRYEIRGDVSSQFISGMIFALVYLGKSSEIQILPPVESKSYINLTISALQAFGADVELTENNIIKVNPSEMKSLSCRIEGDYSGAAFLEAFNYIGSSVEVGNLRQDSLQGDRVYAQHFKSINDGVPTVDISDCPDLGPVLIALAALKNGAVFTGTARLKDKESDRGCAMQEELSRLGGELIIENNRIIVQKRQLSYKGEALKGHNDHRIVMAMSVILSQTGGSIDDAEAVSKSYPTFFDDIRVLGAKVELK